jgi:cation:H+ antiporter
MESLALWQLLAVFAVASAVIVAAGIALAQSGDEIAGRTGLGGFLVGMLLLATATSLPELATGVSAALDRAPDLAVGNLLGSSMANMAILAVIDLAHRGRVWPTVGIAHARLASIAIALTALAVLAVLSPSGIALGWVGIETVLIVAAYIAAAAWISRSPGEGRRARDISGEIISPIRWASEVVAGHSLRFEIAVFAIAAGVILAMAPILTLSAEGIAKETGIGETFIGALALAATTSLPELVASLAAIRIGAYDLAVGNLFGSNAFNMTILLGVDLAYTPGPILAVVDPSQVIAGVGAILLMAIALAAVVHGTRTRFRKLEPDAVVLLVAYVLLLAALWRSSS